VDITSLLIFLLIGAIAGWLAGQIIKGGGFGVIGNIVVGVRSSVISWSAWSARLLAGSYSICWVFGRAAAC